MCNSNFNPRLSPVTERQMVKLGYLYPAQAGFIRDVYTAMTRGLAPQVNLLVMFTVLRHQYLNKAAGILEDYNLLYVPLSVVAKTGEKLWTRFRPKPVQELHTAFLSFMMAETNRNAVNGVCGQYELAFGQSHCCGVLFGSPEDVKRYRASQLYSRRNFLRSAIESLAMPVEEVSFKDIPENNIDLGPAELEFFELYEETFDHLYTPRSPQMIPEAFLKKVDGTWEEVLAVTPTAVLL